MEIPTKEGYFAENILMTRYRKLLKLINRNGDLF
jgi:hypothetical protein